MSKLFCFIGPSGGGKSTIQHSLPIKFLTHFVTRELREGEINGYHAMHCSRERFELDYDLGHIATRTEYADNLYGAPISSIHQIKKGIPHHATVPAYAIEQFERLLGHDNVVVIYIKPTSVGILRDRMLKRGDKPEDIERRIAHIYSATELENEKLARYVVVNNDLGEAIQTVIAIIRTELGSYNLDKFSK